MDMRDIAQRGIVLLGCGKMGSALLEGWLKTGLPVASVHVLEPAPSDWLKATGVHLNGPLPATPAMALLAVKPQMMGAALPRLQALGGGGTVFVSIAAGTSLQTIEDALGVGTPVVRVMPNTPAAVGRGISALIGNARVSPDALALAQQLMAAVGETVLLDSESQMDAVTGLSGSGPAFVYLMIEALSDGGVAAGLPREMATYLAAQTVKGAACMVMETGQHPGVLKDLVSSPGGSTIEGIRRLEEAGVRSAFMEAVLAAAKRSRQMGRKDH